MGPDRRMVDISYSASGKIAMLRQYARQHHRENGAARFDPSVFAFGKLKRRNGTDLWRTLLLACLNGSGQQANCGRSCFCANSRPCAVNSKTSWQEPDRRDGIAAPMQAALGLLLVLLARDKRIQDLAGSCAFRAGRCALRGGGGLLAFARTLGPVMMARGLVAALSRARVQRGSSRWISASGANCGAGMCDLHGCFCAATHNPRGCSGVNILLIARLSQEMRAPEKL